jgi:hypothetical protein
MEAVVMAAAASGGGDARHRCVVAVAATAVAMTAV